jgi:hypothetical protein
VSPGIVLNSSLFHSLFFSLSLSLSRRYLYQISISYLSYVRVCMCACVYVVCVCVILYVFFLFFFSSGEVTQPDWQWSRSTLARMWPQRRLAARRNTRALNAKRGAHCARLYRSWPFPGCITLRSVSYKISTSSLFSGQSV